MSKKVEEAKNKLIALGCKILKIEQIGDNTSRWYIDYSYNGIKYHKDIYKICKYNEESILKGSLDHQNPYCIENASIMEKENNPYNSYIVSTKKGDNKIGTVCTYVCGICGKYNERRLYDYIRSPYKICEDCRTKLHTSKLKDEAEVFKDIENNYGFKILNNQHYNGIHEKIGIINKEGYKGAMCYVNIKAGAKLSPFAKYNPYALENLRHYIKINGIDCVIPNQKYNGWDSPLKIQCACGKIFKTTLTHFMIDKQYQCGYCSNSKSNNEKVVELWLKQNNINFIPQYTFKDCYYKKALPFDFYIANTNILIEVDGEQHFKPVYFGGKTSESKRKRAQKLFDETIKRDKIKNNFCEKNGYNLIRIPYTEIDNGNYKNILSQLFIKE